MTAPKLCPTCSAEYPATERFCPKDGTALRSLTTEMANLVGSVIGERYHVLQKLGEGGMGQVYLAEHVKMGRRSAVKVMNPALVHDTGAVGRFNREAANASRIEHPNVAGIYDFGETADGIVYLAMQYVEGETLTQLVRRHGALAPARAGEIARQAAEGLHAAHALGIVHRDLKPDNIMVARDADGHDVVKVVDFGIAKAAGAEGQQVTRTGIVVGTPEYMSPEQLAGEPVHAASDTYSLALVTYNMLTGDLPFPAESTQTAMIMRLTEQPRTLTQAKPDVAWPAEVEAVMARALEREPGRRHHSARDFGRAIGAALAAMPTPNGATRTIAMDAAETTPAATPLAATGPGPTARRAGMRLAGAAPSRRELAIAGGVVAALVVAVVAVMAARGGLGRGREGARALEEGIAAYRAGRREAAAERFLAATAAAPDDPTPHVYLARMAREANNLAAATTEAVKAVQLAPNDAPALRELASIMYVQQRFTGARTFYARALKEDPGDRLSQGYLGCSLMRLGRPDQGMRWLTRAGPGPWSSCGSGGATGSAPGAAGATP